MEPPFPFHTIHIDHKQLAVSGGFGYILIVVCRLTRFTFAIPVKSTSSEDTLKALMTVFNLFGLPHYIYSDNASGFNSSLMEEFAKYAGLRAIRVLPNSPQGNSPAEQGVRRVADLIHKHTRRHQEWHLTLGAITFALNTHVHTSTGTTPFEAVFGRRACLVPDLETPHLTRYTSSGSDFVKSLADNLSNASRR